MEKENSYHINGVIVIKVNQPCDNSILESPCGRRNEPTHWRVD
ncbi:hypothetical protein SLEP1_g40301 [Rubroshorea leprosula]|uniref:Uncharacterized protein n=1 Tax=Rubroshorea leprosula TaxID=152421 RepID=A0AAV5L3F9_9ROSI|nr:hypothetical protein SLEP1_g40301 [Rubroshorea leprosula]